MELMECNFKILLKYLIQIVLSVTTCRKIDSFAFMLSSLLNTTEL